MVEIATSILTVPKDKIIKTIYNLETAKTDYFHIDVMDGIFVESNTTEKMIEYCDYLNSITNIPLDIHLMVKDIKKYIDMFVPYNPNIITIHYESVTNKDELLDMLDYIKLNNCKAGIAIKPDTDINKIYDILKNVHLVLIMTVEPGKGGQTLITDMIAKIDELKTYAEKNSLEIDIEADGGINLKTAERVKNAGANILVAGTAILKAADYKVIIDELKQE